MAYEPAQISDLINRPPRDIWVKDGNAKDLIDCVRAYGLERTIQVPSGTYNIGSEILEVTFPSTGTGRGGRFSLKGHAKTIIEASGAKVFDVLNTAWITVSDFQAIMNIENLIVKHNCQNATDISIDLDYSHPWLKNIRTINTNATRQGCALKSGVSVSGSASSSGMQPTVIGFINAEYSRGFDLCLDHMVLINTESYEPLVEGYYYRAGCNYLTSYSPMIVSKDADAATLFPWYFDNIGRGCAIYNAQAELPTGMTNAIFTRNVNAYVDIYGVSAYPKNTLKNASTINIYGRMSGSWAENWGTATGTGAQQTIAHGIAGVPGRVVLSEYNTGGALAYESAAADSTNIYVTAVLNKTFRWYCKA